MLGSRTRLLDQGCIYAALHVLPTLAQDEALPPLMRATDPLARRFRR